MKNLIQVSNDDLKKLEILDELVEIIPRKKILEYRFLIFRLDHNCLSVVTDSFTLEKINFLKIYFNYEIKIYLGNKIIIDNKLNEYFFSKDNLNLFTYDNKLGTESKVEKFNEILGKAVYRKATDIHIEPEIESSRIRFRVNGKLLLYKDITKEEYLTMVTRIKILSGLNISEVKIPQDGRTSITIDHNKIDLRISTFPTILGEKLVIRILDKSKFNFKLTSLGINSEQIKEIKEIISQPYGLILVTGPSGSGKTTTLYTILNELNTIEKNIQTIEDPVEYIFKSINQSQVNYKQNFTFEIALKHILRQDPDIILIGEIRDNIVANIALKSAITGHLVLSTLHTNNSLLAIQRLIDLNVEKQLISSSIIGIISQRLVRKLCDRCKIREKINPSDIYGINLGINVKFIYKSKGCEYCNLGYTGLIPIMEILKINKNIRRIIGRYSSIEQLEDYISKRNNLNLEKQTINLLREGKISINDAKEILYTLEYGEYDV